MTGIAISTLRLAHESFMTCEQHMKQHATLLRRVLCVSSCWDQT